MKPVRRRKTRDTIPGDYAIIVTAYKYAGNLDNVIRSLLKTDHPNFIIYVVADCCPDYRYYGENGKVVVLHPPEPLTNQVKSHFYAISNFRRNHNRLTIIDSDNLAEPHYLKGLDELFTEGYEAVQGVRKAKNLNTPLACLDAINEMYYLYYDRIILFNIGSSSMLSGSGMAFTVDLYRMCLENLDTEGAGFDKVLQKQILDRGYRIAFAPGAVVLDEKTSTPDQLVKQRARWNNTWFRFFPYSLSLMKQGLVGFNLNKFLFGFILFRPPLFILAFLVMLILLANIFINPLYLIAWGVILILFSAGFFLALLSLKAEPQLYRALGHIPKFIFYQVLSLFKAKKANQFSVATEHSFHKEIEDIEK